MPCKELLHVFDFCVLGNVESTFLLIDNQAKVPEMMEENSEMDGVLRDGWCSPQLSNLQHVGRPGSRRQAADDSSIMCWKLLLALRSLKAITKKFYNPKRVMISVSAMSSLCTRTCQ